MCNTCDDNRFQLIEKYKTQLIEATNIADDPKEMDVLDNILFRFWQIGWLDKLEKPVQQWIPCSERLPEKFGDYLVSVKRHGWNCEEHIENDIAYWDDLEGFHKAEEVLAWMPLPKPYKGENAND